MADKNKSLQLISEALRAREAQLLLLTFITGLIISILTPNFLTDSNLKSVAMGMTYDLVVALGMTYVLILGGLDLSVGSNIALSGIITTL